MLAEGNQEVCDGSEDGEAVILSTKPNASRKAMMPNLEELIGQRSPLSAATAFRSPMSPIKPQRSRPEANLNDTRLDGTSEAETQAANSNTEEAKKESKSYASPILLKRPLAVSF